MSNYQKTDLNTEAYEPFMLEDVEICREFAPAVNESVSRKTKSKQSGIQVKPG